MGGARVLVIAAGAAVLALAQAGPNSARASSPARVAQAPAGTAFLNGVFSMSGRITVARGVPHEHRGQRITRRWTFLASACPTGPCPGVGMARQRGVPAQVDLVPLMAIAPGVWHGAGAFFAALRCHGRLYPHGEQVPYTIAVRQTATTPAAGGPVVSAVVATYVNRARIDLTPCPSPVGHDAARYTGVLVSPPPNQPAVPPPPASPPPPPPAPPPSSTPPAAGS